MRNKATFNASPFSSSTTRSILIVFLQVQRKGVFLDEDLAAIAAPGEHGVKPAFGFLSLTVPPGSVAGVAEVRPDNLIDLSETAGAGERESFKSFQLFKPFKSFEATHKFKWFNSFQPSNAFRSSKRMLSNSFLGF